ncbi:Homeodomain-like protein [Cynara cardunculus var. scolymus]|uniref:Homeodomain-like protein n=1 Tax=Cynara cardunculus var. scolymus TaxID=59895 RepID=A0A103D5C4_CYNCS|nr:Homeodomain-like protein [Cynara cardunculus var. scolymus]
MEKQILFDLQGKYGNKWAKISTYLPGRSVYHVKNVWYNHQTKMARFYKGNTECLKFGSSPDEKKKKERKRKKKKERKRKKNKEKGTAGRKKVQQGGYILVIQETNYDASRAQYSK